MLDAAGEVVRPALIWCDQRTEEECRAITERVGAKRLIDLGSESGADWFYAAQDLVGARA